MLKAWVGYLIGDGQKLLPDLGFAPLPASVHHDGHSAAQQDHLVGVRQDRHVVVSIVIVMHDQIGSLS